MDRKVNVIEDLDGQKIVFIHDILFKGKRTVNWLDVEEYLRRFVGEFYQIEDCNRIVYIGADLPDEYAHSNYTHILKGANAKAKANAAQGPPELLQIAANEIYEENGEIIRYNVFSVVLLVRHNMDGKYYLYDIMKIKKETSNLFQSDDFTQ